MQQFHDILEHFDVVREHVVVLMGIRIHWRILAFRCAMSYLRASKPAIFFEKLLELCTRPLHRASLMHPVIHVRGFESYILRFSTLIDLGNLVMKTVTRANPPCRRPEAPIGCGQFHHCDTEEKKIASAPFVQIAALQIAHGSRRAISVDHLSESKYASQPTHWHDNLKPEFHRFR
jgi:hypothetical protein